MLETLQYLGDSRQTDGKTDGSHVRGFTVDLEQKEFWQDLDFEF